jgi:two-component system, NtrC family, sensor kinase
MEVFDDLTQNLEKITLHGKRASSIVKGMLEHSRTSTGEKELTDINALADEYLRLAYHGLRAKDNTFNSDFKTELDPNLPKVAVIPQDIGRVLLNLINNSFYAVRMAPQPPKGERKQPLVIVSTKLISGASSPSQQERGLGGEVQIIIKDNGSGMSKEVLSKIFQPFFTTKPTGEGTGLGLSLAYDIVTKGHGGTIEVESVEKEGTTFIVKLTIQNN